ncbi:MAG TPA: hypothetical protein DEB39_16200 [Planctomycetaceae bacterium]|nr:hypothetical protein [Planctomycetaceae bacterium]
MAIHNYHDTNSNLPGKGYGHNANVSPFIGLLPFIEQNTRFAECNETINQNTGDAADPMMNDRECWQGLLSFLMCPSDPNTRNGMTAVSGRMYTPTNYVFSEGDCYMPYGRPNNLRSPFGMIPSPSWGSSWGGGSANTFAVVTDGLSNTIFMSERCSSPGTGLEDYPLIQGGIANVNPGAGTNYPQVCLNTRAAGGTYKSTVTAVNGSGTFFGHYNEIYTAFHVILPPNAPSCSVTTGTNGSYPELGNVGRSYNYLPPTSFHPGGVIVGLGDGSIRFISETIFTGNLGRFPKYYSSATSQDISGETYNGVWGAMGSMNGGEAAVSF